MKGKYTKRFVAFLLAAVMVITGVPVDGIAVKAAETTVTYDFTRPTAGVSSDGTTITNEPTATGYNYLTISYAGANLCEQAFGDACVGVVKAQGVKPLAHVAYRHPHDVGYRFAGNFHV